MKIFTQLIILATFLCIPKSASAAQTFYYDYLYNTDNKTNTIIERLKNEYPPFQFTIDSDNDKCYLTDKKGGFPYSFLGKRNGWIVYGEDKPGAAGQRKIYFSDDCTNMKWDCPEDYIKEQHTVRILRKQ